MFEHSVPSQGAHEPFTQLWLAAQTLPQAPQLNESAPRSTQLVPQAVKPDEQACTHLPL
jgi:hypothetical protein